MKITLTLSLAVSLLSAQGTTQQPQPQPRSSEDSPAQKEAKKASEEKMTPLAVQGAVTSSIPALVASHGNPIVIAATALTGVLTVEIKRQIASSTWAMNMTQKYAAKGIAEFMTKQEGEQFEVANSKVDGLVILSFSAKGITQEKAERLARQEPMWKFRKTSWDRIVFTNGTDAFAWDTATEFPK
jgi:hypothetical protein